MVLREWVSEVLGMALFTLVIMTGAFGVNAREVADTIPAKVVNGEEQLGMYVNPFVKAKFIGGQEALMKFLAENIHYPQSCGEVQGKVIVRFVVTEKGNVTNIEIIRHLESYFDHEVVRIVRKMDGLFIPAQINGKSVNSWFLLPITFRLADREFP